MSIKNRRALSIEGFDSCCVALWIHSPKRSLCLCVTLSLEYIQSWAFRQSRQELVPAYRAILDPVRIISFITKQSTPLFMIRLIVALKPGNLTVALKR